MTFPTTDHPARDRFADGAFVGLLLRIPKADLPDRLADHAIRQNEAVEKILAGLAEDDRAAWPLERYEALDPASGDLLVFVRLRVYKAKPKKTPASTVRKVVIDSPRQLIEEVAWLEAHSADADFVYTRSDRAGRAGRWAWLLRSEVYWAGEREVKAAVAKAAREAGLISLQKIHGGHQVVTLTDQARALLAGDQAEETGE